MGEGQGEGDINLFNPFVLDQCLDVLEIINSYNKVCQYPPPHSYDKNSENNAENLLTIRDKKLGAA